MYPQSRQMEIERIHTSEFSGWLKTEVSHIHIEQPIYR